MKAKKKIEPRFTNFNVTLRLTMNKPVTETALYRKLKRALSKRQGFSLDWTLGKERRKP